MGIFSPSIKTICNVIFENNTSKFFIKVFSGKNVKKEQEENLVTDNQEEIVEALKNFVNSNREKKVYYNVMLRNLSQGIANSKAELIKKEILEDEFFIQKLDKNCFLYSKKEEISALEEKFGVKFNTFMPTLKILYNLLKSQEIDSNSLFILKTDEEMSFIIANKKEILYSSVVSITDEILAISLRDNLSIEIDDIDEVFFVILKNEILKYYASDDSNFIDNIYIFNNGSLNNEISYIIYTRLLIMTNLIPLKIFDVMSDIALKEL